MKSDAKKAASLVDKSIELSHELKFEKAEKTYLKAQEIINKYIEKDKATEFFEHFAAYRDKEKKQNAK
jgi:thymidine phosphorylase